MQSDCFGRPAAYVVTCGPRRQPNGFHHAAYVDPVGPMGPTKVFAGPERINLRKGRDLFLGGPTCFSSFQKASKGPSTARAATWFLSVLPVHKHVTLFYFPAYQYSLLPNGKEAAGA